MMVKPTYNLSTSIVVLGGGESGVGAAILAAKKGYEVFVSDAAMIKARFKEDLHQYDIPYEEGRA